ncbi:hypothetical protein [Phytobacter sp. V91]|uniref:hypothetical protein n=1 Tax=Phytobacter sp. V91 TaxID=3369425 RepID=UPI003F60733D
MSTVLYPETTVEQTDDGGFRRQNNAFTTRFGPADGQLPVEAGRYRLIVSASCGWSRRILILLRLLGLDASISVGYVFIVTMMAGCFQDSPARLMRC